MSRGACICSSASRSRRRFPTAAAAPPAPAPGLQTDGAPALSLRHPSAAERPQPIIAWRAPQVGWFIFPIVAAPFGLPTAMPIERRHPAAAERPRPIIAWRAPQVGRFIFPIDAAPLGRPTAISTLRAVHFGTQTPAAGFAPPTRHARSLILPPHAAHRRLISSYEFLLSPSLFPAAAPIGPPLRAVGHRPAGTGAVCSSFLSAPRRRDSNGLFFHLQVLPVLAAPPAPLQASAPVALPRPPLGGRSPRPSAAQSPESRLCGGLSASIHPLHPPHRPCPKIIVLRSASL